MRQELDGALAPRPPCRMPYRRPWRTSSRRPVSVGSDAAGLADVADPLAHALRLAAQVEACHRGLPAVGGSSVASIRSVVVLPAPLGPRKPKTSPAATAQVDAAHGLDRLLALAERSAQAAGLDNVVHGRASRGLLSRAPCQSDAADISRAKISAA